jgi:DNA processing protein
MRNRIISGLADIVLVIEAREKSGTQITVDTALEQGREVLAVPGRVTDRLSDGCNLLISQGAGVAISISDVLERLSCFDTAQKETSTLECKSSKADADIESDELANKEPEKAIDEEILDLIDIIPVSASNIIEGLNSRDLDISIPQLMTKLMDLTYKGLILQEGVYFRKKV